MLVTWNQPNVFTGYKKSVGEPEVAYRLLPGVNEVPDEVWAEAEKHPMVQKHIELMNIETLSKPDKDNKKSRIGLAMYEIPEAKKIITKTYDVLLLKKWSEMEKREALTSAIDKQLKSIDEKTKPAKKEETEEDDE